MIIFHGIRTARIKKDTNYRHACENCGAFDLDVKIYRDYYHVFFVPIFPVNDKSVKIVCNNCREYIPSTKLQKHYKGITKTPVYLYAMPLLFVLLIAFLISGNIYTQKEKAVFVENPEVGDVYLINEKEDNSRYYYFLRLAEIKDDALIMYHNNLIYSGFVSELAEEDYFVKDEEIIITKSELKQMLDKSEITSVERNYKEKHGFNRIY